MEKKFIVRLPKSHGGYALHFHQNPCGRWYSAVTDAEASTFADNLEAGIAAVQHRVPVGFTVEPLTTEALCAK